MTFNPRKVKQVFKLHMKLHQGAHFEYDLEHGGHVIGRRIKHREGGTLSDIIHVDGTAFDLAQEDRAPMITALAEKFKKMESEAA